MSQLTKDNNGGDSTFSNALHGSSVASKGGILALSGKHAELNKAAVDKYFSHWGGHVDQDELLQAREARRESYIDVASSYYNIVTDMFEHFFFGRSFHFFRILPNQPLSDASRQHEHYLASKLNLQPHHKVLDVGCGVGGPAREIARHTGVNVVGLNFNEYQIQRAARYTVEEGLESQVSFVKGDFMKMDFKPNSFDGAYSIEATSYAPSLKGVYSEIFKALKPGGILAVYELIMTDEYNDGDPDHRRLRSGLEQGMGVPAVAKISDAIAALKAAGFELREAEDLSRRPNEVPWHYPFSGSWTYLNSIWDARRIIWMALLHLRIASAVMILGEWAGVFPPGTTRMKANLTGFADHAVRASKANLFTPIFILVGQKPLL